MTKSFIDLDTDSLNKRGANLVMIKRFSYSCIDSLNKSGANLGQG